ncbi:MAG: hypothetical protein ACRD2L_26565 [Terriglobia bacterium]
MIGCSNLLTPFDLDQVRLQRNFRGHDFSTLAAALISRRESIRAYDEFETIQQRDERIKKINSNPLIGDLSIESLYAFQSYPLAADDMNCWYSISEEVLFSFFEVSDVLRNALRGVSLSESSLKTMKEIFLADHRTLYPSQPSDRIDLLRTSVAQRLVCVNPSEFEPYEKGPAGQKGILAKIKIPPDQARQLKPNLRALLVCKLVSPFAAEDVIRSKPSFRRPEGITSFLRFLYVSLREVWFYDLDSGQIHLKIKPGNRFHEGRASRKQL